jgi:hypothetical protein
MPGAGSWRGVRLFTIGHSTRTADELISILRAFGVSIVADIRTIPRSRHNPQFEGKVLARPFAATSSVTSTSRRSEACATLARTRRIRAGTTRASAGSRITC